MGQAYRVTSTEATQQCVPVPHSTRGCWCIGWGAGCVREGQRSVYLLCLPVWMPSAPRSSLRLCPSWSHQPQHNSLISLKPSPATRASSLPLNFSKSSRTAARRQPEGKGRATRKDGWGLFVSWLGVPSSSSRAWLLGTN